MSYRPTAFEVECVYCGELFRATSVENARDGTCGRCRRIAAGQEQCPVCREWLQADQVRTRHGIRKCYECWSDPDA